MLLVLYSLVSIKKVEFLLKLINILTTNHNSVAKGRNGYKYIEGISIKWNSEGLKTKIQIR